MRPVGIDHAIFDPEDNAWTFEDELPAFAGWGRWMDREDGVPGFAGEAESSELSRLGDARLMHRLGLFASHALDPPRRGCVVPRDTGARDAMVRDLAETGAGVRNAAQRARYSEVVLALKRYLGAEVGPYREFARGELRECLDGGWFEDAGWLVKSEEEGAGGSLGLVGVVVLSDPEGAGVGAGERAAYERVRGDAGGVAAQVLEAVLAMCREVGEGLAVLVRDVPRVSSVEDVRDLIRLDGVFVHREREGGGCDIGFGFSCAWNPEHGLGVRLSADGSVEVGEFAIAFRERED